MRVIYTSKGMLKKFGVRVMYRKIWYILWPVWELIDLVIYYAFRDFWWLKYYPLQHVSVKEILDV
jgi:hypothetical protein